MYKEQVLLCAWHDKMMFMSSIITECVASDFPREYEAKQNQLYGVTQKAYASLKQYKDLSYDKDYLFLRNLMNTYISFPYDT